MDRRTRKDLKTDKFAQEVGHTYQYITEHKSQVTRYVVIGAVVVVAGLGWWIFSSRQSSAREKALADAMHVADAQISATPTPPNLNFATQEEKDKAVLEAYTKVATEHRGSQEGAIANLYVAAMKLDDGDLAAAEKAYTEIMNSAPDAYASVAKKALAEVYAAQGKMDQAEKMLREMMNDPTVFVSSEEAALTLGRLLAKDKPAEARKLLEPLRESRTAVSRAALETLSKIPQTPAAN